MKIEFDPVKSVKNERERGLSFAETARAMYSLRSGVTTFRGGGGCDGDEPLR